MALASTSDPMVEGTCKDGCCQCLSPGWAAVAPGVSRFSRWVWPRLLFRLLLLPWVLERVILCVPFKSVELPKVSPTNLQCQTSWGLISLYQCCWAWCGAQTPCSLGRTSAVVINLPFVHHLPRGMGLDYIAALLLLSRGFFLVSLVVNLFC